MIFKKYHFLKKYENFAIILLAFIEYSGKINDIFVAHKNTFVRYMRTIAQQK